MPFEDFILEKVDNMPVNEIKKVIVKLIASISDAEQERLWQEFMEADEYAASIHS